MWIDDIGSWTKLDNYENINRVAVERSRESPGMLTFCINDTAAAAAAAAAADDDDDDHITVLQRT